MFDKISRDVKMNVIIMIVKRMKTQQIAKVLEISKSIIYHSKIKMTKYDDIKTEQWKRDPQNSLSSRIQDIFSLNLFYAS